MKTKITASSAARSVMNRLKQTVGGEAKPPPAPPVRRDDSLAIAAMDPFDRVRLARAALAIEANPLATRAKIKVFPTAPTPERLAKMGNGSANLIVHEGAGQVAPLKSHRERLPMEKLEKHFTEEEMSAYRQFMIDAEMATKMNLSRTTANYEGSSGGGSGQRAGGVPDRVRKSYAQFNWVWTKLPVQHRVVAFRMLMGERFDASERSLTPEDMGRLFSKFADSATAKGVAVGLIKGTLWTIADLYRKASAMDEVRMPSTPEEIEARRQARRERVGINWET